MQTSGVKRGAGLSVVLAVVMSLLAACGDSTATSTGSASTANTGAGLTKVVATTTQLNDFVKNVGGNRVEVTSIIKPNVDAHEYEPTAEDSKAIAAALVVFKNGLNLEEWLDKTIQNSGTKATVVDTSAGVKIRKAEGAEADNFKEGDPHIWFSTENARKMVDNIAAGLAKADPAGATTYQSNATRYKAEIEAMAKTVRAEIEAIPPANRKLVTNHDAFGYFIEEFGLTFVGSVVPSLDSTAEPSAKEIQDLINRIKEQKVKAIFTESSINPKLAEQISKEAGVKIFSNLYGDSLGEAGSDGETYLKMMLANAKNISAALK